MEPIKTYLTIEGWKKDFQKTKEDLSSIISTNNNSMTTKKNQGSVLIKSLVALAATPLCAYAFSYAGQATGWVVGNLVDMIPYACDVAPWLSERVGLFENAKTVTELNENLYQAAGAVSGFWSGLLLPWKIWSKVEEAYKK